MAKAFLILCMSEALVASDALHVIMRQTLPATFAKHQPVRFSLLRPEAKTVNTGGHILGVCNVVVNQHATFRQSLAWDAKTMSDSSSRLCCLDASIICFQSCVLGIALTFALAPRLCAHGAHPILSNLDPRAFSARITALTAPACLLLRDRFSWHIKHIKQVRFGLLF